MTVAAGILGLGMAVPDRVLTNAELERIVDTSDEWIVSRTGIRERRICDHGETTATLGTTAARRALEDAAIDAADIDLVICATASSDFIWPSTACIIQDAIGARRAAAFDLGAACSGFVYGVETAAGFVRSGSARNVLLIGADTLSKMVDWQDRSTCVLFGDGAGAAVIGPCDLDEGILGSALRADGAGLEHIILRAGGTRHPITPEAIEKRWNRIAMKGSEVFKFAVRAMGEIVVEALGRAGLTVADVDLCIPHQANSRIVHAAAERIDLSDDKIFLNVDRYGNTSAASVPMALCEAIAAGRVQRGGVVVTVGFGAGLTWGANAMRWSRIEPH